MCALVCVCVRLNQPEKVRVRRVCEPNENGCMGANAAGPEDAASLAQVNLEERGHYTHTAHTHTAYTHTHMQLEVVLNMHTQTRTHRHSHESS